MGRRNTYSWVTRTLQTTKPVGHVYEFAPGAANIFNLLRSSLYWFAKVKIDNIVPDRSKFRLRRRTSGPRWTLVLESVSASLSGNDLFMGQQPCELRYKDKLHISRREIPSEQIEWVLLPRSEPVDFSPFTGLRRIGLQLVHLLSGGENCFLPRSLEELQVEVFFPLGKPDWNVVPQKQFGYLRVCLEFKENRDKFIKTRLEAWDTLVRVADMKAEHTPRLKKMLVWENRHGDGNEVPIAWRIPQDEDGMSWSDVFFRRVIQVMWAFTDLSPMFSEGGLLPAKLSTNSNRVFWFGLFLA